MLSGRAAYDYAMTARKRTKCLGLACLTDLTNIHTIRRSFLRDGKVNSRKRRLEPYD